MLALASWNAGTPTLVAGGAFESAGGVPARKLARLQNGAWTAFGTGADGAVLALRAKPASPSGAAFSAGGAFTVIDGRSSMHCARSN